MARKKKASKQPKRLELTDTDGWTHIIKGLKNVHLNKPSVLTKALQPAEIPQDQTLNDLQRSHARYRDQWLSSPCYRSTRQLFLAQIPFHPTEGKGKIDRCVVLGLGSLSNGRRSSWWELVFLETILSLLSASPSASDHPHQEVEPEKTQRPQEATEERGRSTAGSSIEVYMQDPIFNTLDNQFLSSLGYTILTHPSAFSKITSSTFLLAPHLELEMYARALAGPEQPALCVGTDLMECMDRLSMGRGRHEDDEDWGAQERIFQQFWNTTLSKRLPEYEKDDWMYFTNIYWRKPLDDQNRGESYQKPP
ncbi:MAG: hypothetical protein L6R40_003844 [Gallowayella cf. fulva]|nr:MAG: hypothetical protein L6R40_003844 [Xanthomendoza cf. fulva]